MSKWGVESFPESDNFELRWEEVPRQKGNKFSDFTIKHEGDYISAMKEIFYTASRNTTLTSLSHEILTGAEPKHHRLTADWDEKTKTYFLENEEGKKERVFYLSEYNISDYSIKEINQLTEKNIPDEITLTIHNFKAFCREDIQRKGAIQEDILKIIKEQLIKWRDAARELGLTDKATRNRKLFDDYLDVWDRLKRGESEEKIAKEKFLKNGSFRKPPKNRNVDDDQKASNDELNDAYDEKIEKFKKEGLTEVEAEEKAANEFCKIENEKDSDERKTTAAIGRVYYYHRRAKKFIKHPQILVGDKSWVCPDL